MKLSPTEFNKLARALEDALVDHKELRLLLRRVGKRMNFFVGENDTFPQAIDAVVGAANSEAWVVELIQKARKMKPHNVLLEAFHDDLQESVGAAAVDPFETCLLRGSRALIDRRDLRDSARLLESKKPEAANILLVGGDPGLGKTHSRYYLKYLSDAFGSFEIGYVNLEKLVPVDAKERLVTAETLGRAIARGARVGTEGMPPKGEEQAARWAQDYCAWLIDIMADRPERWVVLDGFGKIGVSSGAHELIHELSDEVDGGDLSDRIHLVLLGYKRDDLPDALQEGVLEEQLRPIGQIQLVGFFLKLIEEGYVTDNSDSGNEEEEAAQERMAARVVDLAYEIVDEVDTASSDYLRLLGRAAHDKATELISEGLFPDQGRR